jgi:hypothetical protein
MPVSDEDLVNLYWSNPEVLQLSNKSVPFICEWFEFLLTLPAHVDEYLLAIGLNEGHCR